MADEPSRLDERFPETKPKTVAEKRARKRVDMSGWRKQLQASKITFDDNRKGIYLNHLRQYGRKMQACRAAGVALNTVADHIANDPDFALAREQALADYADIVQQLAWKLMEGVKKPIVGGKDKNEIITHEIVHATNLLAMEMKKTNPEYKDRQEIDVNNKGGGVLVVPAGVTPEEFMKEIEAKNATKTVMPGSEDEKK